MTFDLEHIKLFIIILLGIATVAMNKRKHNIELNQQQLNEQQSKYKQIQSKSQNIQQKVIRKLKKSQSNHNCKQSIPQSQRQILVRQKYQTQIFKKSILDRHYPTLQQRIYNNIGSGKRASFTHLKHNEQYYKQNMQIFINEMILYQNMEEQTQKYFNQTKQSKKQKSIQSIKRKLIKKRLKNKVKYRYQSKKSESKYYLKPTSQ